MINQSITDEGEVPLSDKEDKPAATTESKEMQQSLIKPIPLSDKEKPISEDKTTSHQNSEDKDKSPVEGLLEPLDSTDPIDDDNTDPIDDDGSDPEKTINTNEKDPFAARD
jgi:hypothetical protein